ncbi:MAG: hypothetical protein HRT88_23280, partial [Lentisphaeraceae bacterium]|nr:hypothetical protein [Lentisphaeraceae bacterium]
TLSRDALVCFRVMQEKSTRDNGWYGYTGRFERTALLKKGSSTLIAALRQKRDQKFDPQQGKVMRFEIILHDAKPGDSIYIDNVRLSASAMPLKNLPISQIGGNFPNRGHRLTVLGTDLKVKNLAELATKLAPKWQEPRQRSIQQVEADFREKYKQILKNKPKAKMVIFRDGQTGFDTNKTEDVYAGWRDTYITCHEPESMLTVAGVVNHGKKPLQEIFMRHRTGLMKADFSSVPQGSKVLAANFVLCRTKKFEPSRSHKVPNMWVMEACNRPWIETEANAFQYARHKYWQNFSGRAWEGSNPDSLPLFIGHGPGQGQVNTWDFIHAMKRWIEQDEPNHGFWVYADSKDWLLEAHFRESSQVDLRPAIMLIYE